MLKARATQMGKSLLPRIYMGNTADELAMGELYCLPVTAPAQVQPGRLDTGNAAYVLETLATAADACLQNEFSALVTGPVQKSLLNNAGFAFSGHTEYLAARAGCHKVVMMLATEGLRVALATTHLPLAAVPAAITATGLTETLQILHHDLGEKFGISQPHILVAGLNPHAGENGHMGREEIDIIMPVLEQLRLQGFRLSGPLPADTLFTPPLLATADAVLAMYHDQGLPVLKHMGFGKAVNITLGLPYIRTSVDHGTALDLAGSGRADPASLLYAINMALDLAKRRST